MTELPHSTTRPDWLANESFVLGTNVYGQILEATAQIEPPRITDTSLAQDFDRENSAKNQLTNYPEIAEENPAGVSLWLAATNMGVNRATTVNGKYVGGQSTREANWTGVQPPTKREPEIDLHFPIYFAAGMANAVAEFFVEQGVMTEEQRQQMSLTDWANIIGTGWFAKIIQDETLTAFATHGTYGKDVVDYREGGWRERLASTNGVGRVATLFTMDKRTEPHENGREYTTARLSKPVVQGFRSRMGDDDAGCPVARTSTKIFEHMLTSDPHAMALVESGRLEVGDSDGKGMVRVRQDMTIIDDTLIVLADWLERYDNKYGTPMVMPDGSVVHEKRPPVDALRGPMPD
jgi:hypothetical protein